MTTRPAYDLKGGDRIVLGQTTGRTLDVALVFDATPGRSSTLVRFTRPESDAVRSVRIEHARPVRLAPEALA